MIKALRIIGIGIGIGIGTALATTGLIGAGLFDL